MGPITLTLHILAFTAILAVGLSGSKGARCGAAALLISFAGAKISTEFGETIILGFFLAAAFLVVLSWKHWVAYFIALIYGFRMIWIGVHSATGIDGEIFWILNNELFVLAQYLLAIYGGVSGGYGHLTRNIRDTFRGSDDNRAIASRNHREGS